MGKIDLMAEDIATIKQMLVDMKPRCQSHADDLEAHDKILRGGNGINEGLCEKVRTIEKRHAAVATIIPIGVVALWEYIKHKTGVGR